MRGWLLVIASMRTKSPSVEEIKYILPFKDDKYREQLESRLILLDRDQLCRLFGPTFVERARLFLDPPVDAARLESKPKSKSNESKSTSKATRGGDTLGDGEQRAL